MHFIHLPSHSPKISQEVLIVTSASLKPSFFHEPSLPVVLLPVQDGWGRTHFSGDSCTRNADNFQHFFFFFASSIVSSLVSARKNPHPCLGPWPQHWHTHLPVGASLDLSFPGTTEHEKSPERRNPAFLRYLFVYFSVRLVACSCRGFASSLFLFSSFSFESVSPPAVVDSSPVSPPLPVYTLLLSFLSNPGALTAQDHGPWSNFFPASSLL